MVDCNYLLQPIIERWKMAHTPNMFPGEGRYPNMFLSAAKHGEKVYVFAATLSHEPMIIEDDAAIYPSDALMAKLAMLEKMDSEKSGGPVQTAQAVHAQQARMRIP